MEDAWGVEERREREQTPRHSSVGESERSVAFLPYGVHVVKPIRPDRRGGIISIDKEPGE